VNYKKTIRNFSKIGKTHFKDYVSPLKNLIENSNLNILFDVYVGKMILFSILAFLITFVSVSAAFLFIGMGLFSLIIGFVTGISMFGIMLVAFHSYPFHTIRIRKNSIEANLPFAINHMAAIASSGVPPYLIFKLISEIEDYKEVTNECKRIVRNMDIFGMDIITAVKNVAKRTPSSEFKKFLQGFTSSIETGGSLSKYLENTSKDAMFEYKLKRESYLKTLSTYADIYTAVLIAAPLFFVSILSIMALVGGQVFGLSIPIALRIGIYGFLPAMNILFLMFIQTTQTPM
jgi:flagellar protein FlaJ